MANATCNLRLAGNEATIGHGKLPHKVSATSGFRSACVVSMSPWASMDFRLHSNIKSNAIQRRRVVPTLLRAPVRKSSIAAAASEMSEIRKDGPGTVYLVGTGPGDPELLTLRAYRLMQTVDVVLYDRLVSDEILDMIHPGALMVYVGKETGFHTRSQEEIHHLLLKYAGDGQSVLRLKGGDPFIFGRGGEEQQFLASQGIEAYVVPGITAAAGICAQLGIPLTHRGVATGVRYMTGHTRDGAENELFCSLSECRDPMTTLVFYMGLQTLPDLRNHLIAAGVDKELPAVAVERGTTAQQREVWAPLHTFVERVQEEGLQSPTLIIMGHVVALGPGWQHHQQKQKIVHQSSVKVDGLRQNSD